MAVKCYHLRQDVKLMQFFHRKWANRKRKMVRWVVVLSVAPNLDVLEAIRESDPMKSSLIHSMFSKENGLYASVLSLVGPLGQKRFLLCAWLCHWPSCHLSQISSFLYVSLFSKALPAGLFSFYIFSHNMFILCFIKYCHDFLIASAHCRSDALLLLGLAIKLTVEHYLKIPPSKLEQCHSAA